ncbi:MAG: NAD(P)H-dependent oxidoreductase, partial [Pseudomonadota bacterium]
MSDAARTVLLVQSSARREGSITRRLAETLARRRAAALGLPLVVRDLGEGVELVDEAWVEANFTDANARSEAQRARLAGSDALVAELKDAAEVIVAAPVYNFGAPASLKAWIDQVARARVTFRYT